MKRFTPARRHLILAKMNSQDPGHPGHPGQPRRDAIAVDVHQHVLPPELIEVLRRRSDPPRVRGWELKLPGEPAYQLTPEDHDIELRRARADRDGLGLALLSLSSVWGVEQLAPVEAAELIEAFHQGALQLPPPFRPWAAACLTELDPAALAEALD